MATTRKRPAKRTVGTNDQGVMPLQVGDLVRWKSDDGTVVIDPGRYCSDLEPGMARVQFVDIGCRDVRLVNLSRSTVAEGPLCDGGCTG